MKFPTAKKVEELAFFNGMMMGTVPGVTFKVEPWNPNGGAKAKLETAWFRITGIPQEKRTERRVSMVASLVGLPLEVDKANLKRWDYVRVKIGCKDIKKVPLWLKACWICISMTFLSRERFKWRDPITLDGILGQDQVMEMITLHQKAQKE
jgi:hypothetical protein